MKKSDNTVPSWVFGSLSFAFLLFVFWFAPKPLGRAELRIVAIVSSLLMGLFAFFLTGTLDLLGHARLPVGGQFSVRASGGIGLFLVTMFWWNSEFAPVKPAPVEALPSGVAKHLEEQAILASPAGSPSEHTIYKLEGATNNSLKGDIAYARLKLVEEAFRREEYDRALDYCNEALNYEPNFPLARFYRARALENLKRDDEALADYSAVTGQVPEFGAAHLGKFLLLSKLRRYREAMPDAKALSDLGFSEPEEALTILLNALNSKEKGK